MKNFIVSRTSRRVPLGRRRVSQRLTTTHRNIETFVNQVPNIRALYLFMLYKVGTTWLVLTSRPLQRLLFVVIYPYTEQLLHM